MSVISIPKDKDNSAFSFMALDKIIYVPSLQYKLKENYINTGNPIYDPYCGYIWKKSNSYYINNRRCWG